MRDRELIILHQLNDIFIISISLVEFIMTENKTAVLGKYLPKPYKKRRYYNKSELAEHCNANDVWVCFFDDIYDLTSLVQHNI